MASNIVYDAIRAYVGATWFATPVEWENEQFARPNSSPWMKIAMTGTFYGQQSIGGGEPEDNRWDEEGQLWLHVFSVAGTGGSEPRRLAKAAADLFRGTRLLDDSLEFLDASIGEGEPGDDDGMWWRISVSVDWRHMEA